MANEQLLGKWHGMVVFSVCISLDLEEDTCDCSQGYVMLVSFGSLGEKEGNISIIG